MALRGLNSVAILTLVLAAGLLAACGGDDDNGSPSGGSPTPTLTQPATGSSGGGAGGSVGVTIGEWLIEADTAAVAAGSVTFEVSNAGAVPHELLVVRTDLAPDDLPTASALVDEDKVDAPGRTQTIVGGDSEALTLELTAGSYVLVCNIAGHYDLGMRAAFTVE